MNLLKAYWKGSRDFRVWMLLPMLLGPIADYYLMESFAINPFVETRFKAQILNILLFETLMLALFFAIGNLMIALEVETAFFAFAGFMNYMVIQFRSTPVVPWDWFSIGTGVSVLDNYHLIIEKRQVIVFLLFALLFILQWPAQWRLWGKTRKKVLTRIIGFLASFGLFCGLTRWIQTDDGVEKWNLYPFLFTPEIMAMRNGFFATYLMDLQYLVVEKPEGYSIEAAQELIEAAGLDHNAQAHAGAEPVFPTIIVIMDEAFSDLSILGEFETNEDPMPFVHSLQQGAENTVTGNLAVSVKGGNTANTEFEFLTGCTMAFLPEGSIPYQQYLMNPMPDALPNALKAYGYTSTAIHPYRAAGWSRTSAYPKMGFDTMLFEDSFLAPVRIRDYISDQSDFEKLIELYEAKKGDGPQLLFNVTMQNHGGYGESYPNFPETITAEGLGSATLDRYLSLIRITDDELKNLVAYFENETEPVAIVFFGDHQPNDAVVSPILAANGKSADTLSEEDEQKRYIVPYVIWANYDIGEQSGADTSANYLAAETLEILGVPVTDYESFLLWEKIQFPVLSGRQMTKADGEVTRAQEHKDETLDYRTVQYYELFDSAKTMGEEP